MAYSSTEEEEEKIRMEAFAQRIHDVVDPSKVDLHYFETQTAQKNHESLMEWAKQMEGNEAQVSNPSERLYLVASDLRLKMSSRGYYISKGGRGKKCIGRKDELYLPRKEIDTLYEKHWAVEINGKYYELTQQDNIAKFSSDTTVEQNDRYIAARIFIGTTHYQHEALTNIGMLKKPLASSKRADV